MPLITEAVKDIVGTAKSGLFQAHAEDLRLKWIILREIPKARFQEVPEKQQETLEPFSFGLTYCRTGRNGLSL